MADEQVKKEFNEKAGLYPGIVSYADASDYRRMYMDEALAPINHTPDSAEVIAKFGEDQVLRVNAVTKQLVDILNAKEVPAEEQQRRLRRLYEEYETLRWSLELRLGAASEMFRRYAQWIDDANKSNGAFLQRAMTAGRESFKVQLTALEKAHAQTIKIGQYIQNLLQPPAPPAQGPATP